jgi:hypothetical protein
MRQKAARVCLIIAIIWLILGAFVQGNAPEWFVISAMFAASAALLGVRLVRISGVVLVVASAAVAIGEYQAEQILRARVREIQRKASEKKSSSMDLYRWPNHRATSNARLRLALNPGSVAQLTSFALSSIRTAGLEKRPVSAQPGIGISGVDGGVPRRIISRHERVGSQDLRPSIYGGLVA